MSVKVLAKHVVVPAAGIFLLSILVAQIVSLHPTTSKIPESATTVLVSVILGFGIREMMAAELISDEEFTLANSVVLNLFLLPIILFNSGFALQTVNFISQLEYILVFAVFGTVISTLFIGFI